MKLTISKKTMAAFCANDGLRPAMEHVYFDTQEKTLVATDGHAMVMIEQDSDYTEDLLIPLDAFPEKRSTYSVIDSVNEKTLEVSFYLESRKDYKQDALLYKKTVARCLERFPNYKNVIHPVEEYAPIEQICVDSRLFTRFANLGDALGNADLLLDFIAPTSAIMITGIGFMGMIMPLNGIAIKAIRDQNMERAKALNNRHNEDA